MCYKLWGFSSIGMGFFTNEASQHFNYRSEILKKTRSISILPRRGPHSVKTTMRKHENRLSVDYPNKGALPKSYSQSILLTKTTLRKNPEK